MQQWLASLRIHRYCGSQLTLHFFELRIAEQFMVSCSLDSYTAKQIFAAVLAANDQISNPAEDLNKHWRLTTGFVATPSTQPGFWK